MENGNKARCRRFIYYPEKLFVILLRHLMILLTFLVPDGPSVDQAAGNHHCYYEPGIGVKQGLHKIVEEIVEISHA